MHRKQPLLDTKVITSWNALMVRALALGGQVLHERRYVDAAARAADFLLTRHRMPDGGLYRASRDGHAKYAGFLDDYAFLVQAMVALHDAGADERWKDAARALAAVMTGRFADLQSPAASPGSVGGFFFTEGSAPDQLVRQTVGTDSPLPSGNGVAAAALVALDQAPAAAGTLAAFAAQLEAQGESMGALLTAAVDYLRDHEPIAVPGGARRPEATPADLAGEAVTLGAEWSDARTLHVRLTIAEGYHVNAHDASAGLTATQVSVGGEAAVAGIDYPPAVQKRFAFAAETINVYAGRVVVTVRFVEDVRAGVEVSVAVACQPCDERACLPAVTRTVSVAGR